MRSHDIEIPEPCHAPWDQMRPEDRGRFCFECQKKVHDLSAMTEPEARDFLRRTATEDVCISYQHLDDGTLLFREPPIPPAPVVPLSRLRHPRTLAAAAMGVGMAAALAACAPHADPSSMRLQSEDTVFQASSDVIPHGEAQPATERLVVEDEPCDGTEPTQSTEPTEPKIVERPRVRGRRPIRRTAGVPLRKPDDPFAGL